MPDIITINTVDTNQNEMDFGLYKISLLPTPLEWKGMSSSAKFSRRKQSKIDEVDKKLEEVWKHYDIVRKTQNDIGPVNIDIKNTLNTLYSSLISLQNSVDAYLEHKGLPAKDINILIDYHVEWHGKQQPISECLLKNWDINLLEAKKKTSLNLQRIKAQSKQNFFKNQRVMAALSLRRFVSYERKRILDNKDNRIPPVCISSFWHNHTFLPTLELWRLDSSGGSKRRWNIRKTSHIRHIDEALKKWWEAFKWCNREETLNNLQEIEKQITKYLNHKENKINVRKHSVNLLLEKVRFEKERLYEQWSELLPPPIVSKSFSKKNFPITAGQEELLDLRTQIPTLDAWKKRSELNFYPKITIKHFKPNITGRHLRSRSSIQIIDTLLKSFWDAFKLGNKEETLQALWNLYGDYKIIWAYLFIASFKQKKSKKRIEHVHWLKEVCEKEYFRLKDEWKDSERLPPFIFDQETSNNEEIINETLSDLSSISEQISSDYLNLSEKEGIIERNDMEIDTISPEEARERVSKRLKNPWKKRQFYKEIGLIQATGIVNYRKMAKERAKNSIKDRFDDYNSIFVEVVSLADAIAQNGIAAQANSSHYLTMSGLGVMVDTVDAAVFGIARMIMAVKEEGWQKAWSKTDKRKLIFNYQKFMIHVGNSLEKYPNAVKILVEGNTNAKSVIEPLVPLYENAAGDMVSLFTVEAIALGITTNMIELRKNLKQHWDLSIISERFSALRETHPQLASVIDYSYAFRGLQKALYGKLSRRKTRAKLGSTQALVGIGSSVVGGIGATIYGGFTVTNAWNPVGWALLGAGLLMTGGFFTYKAGRRYQQYRKLKDAKRGYFIPDWIKTFGEWERFQVADLMFRAAIHDPYLPPEHRSVGYALMFVLLGGDLKDCCTEVRQMGHAGVMAFIKG